MGDILNSGTKIDLGKVKESFSEKLKNILIGFAAFLVPVLGIYFTYTEKDKEIEKEYVSLGIKILSDEPKENNINLRSWAVDLINYYSRVPIKDNTKEELIKKIPLINKNNTIYNQDEFYKRNRSNYKTIQENVYAISYDSTNLGYIYIPPEASTFCAFAQQPYLTGEGSSEFIDNLVDKETFLKSLGYYILATTSSGVRLIITSDDGSNKWMTNNKIRYGKETTNLNPLGISHVWHPYDQKKYVVTGWLNY